jgi:Flp pilus assembly protein TadG
MRRLRILHNERAQSIVEISLITPLLLIALYIPVDFGVSLFAAHLTQNAVREVARIAATQAPTAFNATSLRTELTNRLPSIVSVVGTPSITKFVTTPANCMGVVTVSAKVRYPFFWYQLMRLFGGTVPNTVDITRSTQMRYEYQPYNTTNTPCTA